MSGRAGPKRIEWMFNAFLAMLIATIVSAGWWVIFGHASGGARWFAWFTASFASAIIHDWRRPLAGEQQA